MGWLYGMYGGKVKCI